MTRSSAGRGNWPFGPTSLSNPISFARPGLMSRTIVVDDPVVAGLLNRLPSAAALGHSRRSFLEHLLCTWRILADWRMPVAVCRAGFMHSAYSTSFYPHALFSLDERDAVTHMIGREAEELAFRFCTMDRRGFWDALVKRPRSGTLTYPNRLRAGAPVRVSRQTLRSLLIIKRQHCRTGPNRG